jgi:hypothetical protein
MLFSWAHARIHVEHNATGRPSAVHMIDPLAGQGSKSRKVLGCREPLPLPPTIQPDVTGSAAAIIAGVLSAGK